MREGWPEVADFNDHVMKVGLSGGTLAFQDQELTLYRHGRPEQVWMNLDYSPVVDEEGRPIGVIAIVVETTAKITAERRLEAERTSLKSMFEQAPGFIAVLSGRDHTIVSANDAYLKLVGHRDIIGKPLKVALPEIARQGFIKLLDRVYRTRKSFVGSGVRLLLDRESNGTVEERFVDFVYQPIRDREGTITGIFVQGHEVTEKIRTEQALQEEARILELLNQTGAEIAGELDLEKVVQKVTDAGVALIGAEFGAFFYNVINEKGESYMLYTLSGVPREKFSRFPMPRNTAVFAPTFNGEAVVRSDDILNDPRYGKNDPHYGMPKGHLPVRSYLAVPVVSRTGEVIGGLFFGHGTPGRFRPEHEKLLVGIAGQAATAIDNARLYQKLERELAERKRAEEALQTLNATLEQRVQEEVAERTKAEEALRQSQKMEAVGQLTGGIAHDFNNMLSVIMGGLNLLQRNLARGETDVARFVEGAMEGAQRAASLTKRLLAFSRQQPLSPEAINVNRLVAGMTELLTRTLGEMISVETVQGAGLWQVKADPVQLENALINLAVNARDAMPDGGKLTIETSNAFIDEIYAKQNGIAPGQYVLIAVTDAGSGMPEEVIEKAFDPFFTTKTVGKGTGLGLSQVYGYVRQSNGHIKIYSEVGVGTTVKIYLPRLYDEADLSFEASGRTLAGTGYSGEVILVVEDEDRVRHFSVEALRELGYTVLEARSPHHALHILESGQKVTLLFTDVVMPEMTGRQLSDQALKLRPDLKVLYTTGYTRNAIVHNGMLDHGTRLISKPFTVEELADKVRAVLDM